MRRTRSTHEKKDVERKIKKILFKKDIGSNMTKFNLMIKRGILIFFGGY